MRVFPNPYLQCNACRQWIAGYEMGKGLVPCGHRTGSTSVCPTWSTARDGCQCAARGLRPHNAPPVVVAPHGLPDGWSVQIAVDVNKRDETKVTIEVLNAHGDTVSQHGFVYGPTTTDPLHQKGES